MESFSIRWSVYCGLATTSFAIAVSEMLRAGCFFALLFYVIWVWSDTLKIQSAYESRGVARNEAKKNAVRDNATDIAFSVFAVLVGFWVGVS